MNKIDRLLYEAKTIRTSKESNILLLVENHDNVFTAGYISPLTGERIYSEYDSEKALNDYIDNIDCKTVIIDDIEDNCKYVPLYECIPIRTKQKEKKNDEKPIGLTDKEKMFLKEHEKKLIKSETTTLNNLVYDDPKMEALFK